MSAATPYHHPPRNRLSGSGRGGFGRTANQPLTVGEWLAVVAIVPFSVLFTALLYRFTLLFWVSGVDGVRAALFASVAIHLALIGRTLARQYDLRDPVRTNHHPVN